MATKTAGKKAPEMTDDSWLGRFKDEGSVTPGSWSWEDGIAKFFKVLGPVHEGTGKKGSDKPKPWLCLVRDLKSKKHYQLILGKMILDAFQESFGGEKIIGKCFGAIRYPVEGANWYRYDVRQIADPETGEEES